MPAILILAGIILVTAGVRNTQGELFALLGEEMLGDGSRPGFGPTAVAVGASASLGYVPGLRGASDALTALVFVSFIAANIKRDNNPFTRIRDFVVNPGSAQEPQNEAQGNE